MTQKNQRWRKKYQGAVLRAPRVAEKEPAPVLSATRVVLQVTTLALSSPPAIKKSISRGAFRASRGT
ncbi:MAG TPA: hypothetical protein VGD42_10330 [Lysobacter sp.]